MAKTHKHKTIDALTLGPAIALALGTTAGTRQKQINNLTPDAAADSVIWADAGGFYIRVSTDDEVQDSGGQKYEPAFTLEEASRWDSSVIQDVLNAVQDDMKNFGVDDPSAAGLRAMTYADALVQERDSLDTDDRFQDGDPSGQGDDDAQFEAMLDQLFGSPA